VCPSRWSWSSVVGKAEEAARSAARFSARPSPEQWAALGGEPAEVAAAAAWPAIRSSRAIQAAPPEILNRCDSWALRMAASMPGPVWAAAAKPGSMEPAFLKQWNKDAARIDEQLAVALQALIEAALGDALRAIGLSVMAAVKDPELRELLRAIPLDDLPAESHRIELRPGRSLRAAITVEDEQKIQRAVDDLLRKARRLFERADSEAFQALADALGLTEIEHADDRVGNALLVLAREFERLVAARSRKIEEAPLGEEPVGERGSTLVPFLIIRNAMLALGGAAISQDGEPQQAQGRALPPGIGDPPAAGGLGTGPALQQALAAEISKIGAEASEAAALAARQRAAHAAEIARLSDEAETIRDQITELREARQAAQQAARGGGAAEKARLEAIRQQITDEGERLRRAEQLLRELRASSAAALDGIRDLRSRFPDGVIDAARLVSGSRMKVTGRPVWKLGNPPNPFPPHVALEGRSPQDGDWDAVSIQPYEYEVKGGGDGPELRERGPFQISGWAPGDHAGCQCSWDFEAVLEIDIGIDSPPAHGDDLFDL